MKRVSLFAIAVCLCGHAWAGTATIAVAANFTDATRDIVPLFEKASGHTVKVSYGSTGKLYAQIENGAPFDVFLAADIKRPSKAEKIGLAVKGTRFTYAKGKLVLWSATPGRFVDGGGAFLKTGGLRRTAIANPKTAPYGLAAKQVMEHLGLWKTLQPTLVQGDSIAQTFQFVATGNAEVGFVALSQVLAWPGKGTSWEIPEADYAPIAQQAVLLKRGRDNPAAQAFLEFLKGPAARAVITRYGYGVQ